MARTGLLFFGMLIFFMAIFFLAQFWGLESWLTSFFDHPQDSWIACVTGVSLLIVDVFLPLPSSLIMIGMGTVLGWFWGAFWSFIGGLGASTLAFVLGKFGHKWVAQFIGSAEAERAKKFIEKWGGLAIILSRPIPLLAESVGILVGTNGMGWFTMLRASFLGLFPICLLYAYTGAYAADADNLWVSSVLVVCSAGLFWGAGRWLVKLK
jgi:uncharacterized membrane protein YdjX (TVP38/TMEM64 family)